MRGNFNLIEKDLKWAEKMNVLRCPKKSVVEMNT